MSHVIVYTLPNCGRCSVLKEKLNNSGVLYEEKNANEYLDVLKYNHIFSAPAMSVDNSIMNFSQACKWIDQIGG